MGSLPVSYSFRHTAASAGVTKASINAVMPEADIFFSSAAVSATFSSSAGDGIFSSTKIEARSAK